MAKRFVMNTARYVIFVFSSSDIIRGLIDLHSDGLEARIAFP